MYVCPGVKVNQGGKGCISERPEKIKKEDWNNLVKMIKSMERVTSPYIEKQSLRGLGLAKDLIDWDVMEHENDSHSDSKQNGDDDNKSPHIWQQAAFGRNIVLNSHTDEDFFLSCLTVLWSRKDYPFKCKPVQFFVFPEDGVAVALRPGDILLFNPFVPHCASSRCHFKDDIIVGSFYLKSALVGGHDNDRPVISNPERRISCMNKRPETDVHRLPKWKFTMKKKSS
jgi:hypothetical protein